jgi:DNA-binding CsgD family transcriptional regulator
LTQREIEILHWVAQGKTNSEIAIILSISAFTVKNHLQRVFQKLDVTNRAQAVSKLMPVASNA